MALLTRVWVTVAIATAVLGWHAAAPVRADCIFGVQNIPTTAGCVKYDLSALQNPNGFNVTDANNYTYIVNLCGNIQSSVLPSGCTSQPASPVVQIVSNTLCPTLGLLSTQTAYAYDPNNATAGIRIVYYNGTLPESSSWKVDYGALGIGDAENGRRTGESVEEVDITARSVTIDLICDPSAGTGQPSDIYEWPTYTYRMTWRSAHACPISISHSPCPAPPFEANWKSLSFRPIPKWFDDVKFGIFLHWGLFSVPSFRSEWYWKNLMTGQPAFVEFHNRVYGCSGVMPEKFPCNGSTFTYADFTSMFHAELFDPDAWATLFKNSGAKYVVLTSKHHEGWCNFPSAQHWNWNSVDVGPHRDLVGDLTDSVRAAGLHMGLYHSLREWYNPLFLEDNENHCKNPKFVDEVLMPTLKDMTLRYKPEVIWADGASGDDPCASDSVKYWKAPEFLSWLYNESPVKDTVLVNARWGTGSGGDYNTGPDRYSPGKMIPEKWESCYTVQAGSWGFDRTEDISRYYNTTFLVYQLVSTVSCNGNLLLNIGPTADGRIVPAFEERLLQMGQWMKVNGDAIYGTKPWSVAQNDTSAKRIWYTQSKMTGDVFAIAFDWPEVTASGTPGDVVLTQVKNAPSTVSVMMMGYPATLVTKQASDGFHITVPAVDTSHLPCQYAWVFSISGLP